MRPSAGLTEALVMVSRAAVNFKKKTGAVMERLNKTSHMIQFA